MDKKQNYKRKNYYHKPGSGGSNHWNNKKKFKNYLQPGMKGFLCTCSSKFREKDCVKESLNILNEYADKLIGSDDIQRPIKTEETEAAAGGDIEDELEKEISNLRAGQWTPGRFTVVDTGMEACIFIKTTIEDPVKLVHTVLTEASETKVQKARFLMRMIPVEVTCRGNLDDIKKAADALFDKHFRCEPTTFSVVVNKRCNDSVLRDEVIHSLARLVADKNNEHKANLKEPKLTVLVEIMKGQCCLSVLEDYKTLRHYNIAELTKPIESSETGESTGHQQAEGEREVKVKEEATNGEELKEETSNDDCATNDEKQVPLIKIEESKTNVSENEIKVEISNNAD